MKTISTASFSQLGKGHYTRKGTRSTKKVGGHTAVQEPQYSQWRLGTQPTAKVVQRSSRTNCFLVEPSCSHYYAHIFCANKHMRHRGRPDNIVETLLVGLSTDGHDFLFYGKQQCLKGDRSLVPLLECTMWIKLVGCEGFSRNCTKPVHHAPMHTPSVC
jgi:hypothetical protein